MQRNQKVNRSILFRMLLIALFVSMALTVPVLETRAGVPAKAAAGSETLKAVDKDGLLLPANYVEYSGEKSAYLQKVTAISPTPLKTVLEFYRREMKSKEWLELPGASVTAEQKAALAFENTQKEKVILQLVRDADGRTGITLLIKSEKAAKADGVLPAAGKTRIYLGNMTEKQAVFTINQKKIAVKAESTSDKSMKNAPFVELAPGKYPFTLAVPGQAPVKDHIEVGANEIWGLIAGPGGALPMQMY
jgi:hypothetical protein